MKKNSRKNNLDLIIKNDVTPVMIQADGRHLWRVFDNLMNNINKYAQPGTRVYIDIIPKDSGAIITFRMYQLHRLIFQAMSSRSDLSEETAREIPRAVDLDCLLQKAL